MKKNCNRSHAKNEITRNVGFSIQQRNARFKKYAKENGPFAAFFDKKKEDGR